MYQKLEAYISSVNPWTNVYGLARSIIALSSLLTLLFNDASILFKPTAISDNYPVCISNISLFCLGINDYFILDILRYICIVVLFLVVIGWRPRVTAIFHWYISFSMFNSITVADGGEQTAAVITLLMLPIALTDSRKWHWEKPIEINNKVYSKMIAYYAWVIIRVQVAILYFHSTIAKLGQAEWVDGTAVYYYTKHVTIGFNDFFAKTMNPILESWLIVIPTWGTLILQTILFAALIIDKKHWRNIFILAIFMHEIFALMLGLVSFSLIMTGVLILYLSPIYHQFSFKFNMIRVFNLKNIYSKKLTFGRR